MANYNQIGYGSSDSETVTKLQERLNQNGANLEVDGKFGPKTLQAVKTYQQENNLTVDGIVGENTWGALNKTSSSSNSSSAPEQPKSTGFQYGPYKPSDTVAQAEALLQQHLSQKPGAYTSPWQDQLNETLQKILNREEFSYDLNGDALYQQYKDQYMLQGQQAMMDTMGQAAALTGGYGNSYAQTAGQQTYQGYLQHLNDRIPELYQLALSKYQMEGDSMRDQAALMAQMEQQDYGRYRDAVSDYNTELGRLTDDARYQAEMDYSKWADDRSFAYQLDRDSVSDKQTAYSNLVNLITSTGYLPTAAELEAAGMSETQAEAYANYYNNQNNKTTTGGYRYYGDGNPIEDDPVEDDNVSAAAIRNMQVTLGVDATGVWDAESQAAANGLSAAEAYKLWNQGKLDGASPINQGNIKAFQSKLHPESQHDAVMRHMYGSYRQYVAEQIENSKLSDAEKSYLISYYGITEADTNYKNR